MHTRIIKVHTTLEGEGFIVDSYPIKIVPLDLALVLGTVLLIGFFAAWYPVRIFTRKF